eukprot:TRINITY_DN2376_c0_g1_i1.p1 TRINITY_DN2376_c0_g1~~TRINITY_DN2376_c0_g1_i1.p1  ORF type:complete len:327 (-),score=13.30 TRINITY_DN2376_c0_g1_i1:279-1259(-)
MLDSDYDSKIYNIIIISIPSSQQQLFTIYSEVLSLIQYQIIKICNNYRKDMKAKWLFSFILLWTLSQAQSFGYQAKCKSYDPSTNECFSMEFPESQGGGYMYTYISQCPDGKVCIMPNMESELKSYCKAKESDGASCKDSSACQSEYCGTSGVCVSRSTVKESDICPTPNTELWGDFYCNELGKVATMKAQGASCSSYSKGPECKTGMCNPKTSKCDTFKNAWIAMDYPKVEGADDLGFKTCSFENMLEDCKYVKNGVTVNGASFFPCFPSFFSGSGKSYCTLGGGEKVVQRIVELVNIKTTLDQITIGGCQPYIPVCEYGQSDIG